MLIESDFVIKGFKHGNTYMIVRNNQDNFDIYQLFNALTKDLSINEIKQVFPSLNGVDDKTFIATFPTEVVEGFLINQNVNITEMNRFRLTLDQEKLI